MCWAAIVLRIGQQRRAACYGTDVELWTCEHEALEAFDERVWERGDLEEIVHWKGSRATIDFRKNEEAYVDAAIEAESAWSTVEALCESNGVAVPMASSFLLFMDSEQYTVIDRRAWEALSEFGYVSGDLNNTSIEQYLLYLGICRTLATEYDVSLRDLDRAHWVLGSNS